MKEPIEPKEKFKKFIDESETPDIIKKEVQETTRVTRGAISLWYNGKRIPSNSAQVIINQIAQKYGKDDVYVQQ